MLISSLLVPMHRSLLSLLLRLLPGDVNLEALLDDEEGRLGLELAFRVNETELEIAQEPRADLVDLEQCEVAADAEVGSAAELSHR